jgi:hypothetical protein
VPAAGQTDDVFGRVFLTALQPNVFSYFAEAYEVAGGTGASWRLHAFVVCADAT